MNRVILEEKQGINDVNVELYFIPSQKVAVSTISLSRNLMLWDR